MKKLLIILIICFLSSVNLAYANNESYDFKFKVMIPKCAIPTKSVAKSKIISTESKKGEIPNKFFNTEDLKNN